MRDVLQVKKRDPCGPNKQCVKKSGSREFHCVCDSGHALIGQSCEDIDECKNTKILVSCKKKGGSCKNTDGSYKCECPPGFDKHPTSHICGDVNECEDLVLCHEEADCQNTRGSYQCTCKKGFAGDGVECVEDIAFKQEEKTQMVLMIGGAAGGGVLLIIAIIAFCYCARKRKKEEENEETIQKMESTLSQFGNEWESSEDSDEDSD